jgi:hypothetical protein
MDAAADMMISAQLLVASMRQGTLQYAAAKHANHHSELLISPACMQQKLLNHAAN